MVTCFHLEITVGDDEVSVSDRRERNSKKYLTQGLDAGNRDKLLSVWKTAEPSKGPRE